MAKGVYDVFISTVVIDEINRTHDEVKKKKLLDVVRKYSLTIADLRSSSMEIENLAHVAAHAL